MRVYNLLVCDAEPERTEISITLLIKWVQVMDSVWDVCFSPHLHLERTFPFYIRLTETLLADIFSLTSCWLTAEWKARLRSPLLCRTRLIHISMGISGPLQQRNEYLCCAQPPNPNSKAFHRYKEGLSSASSALCREILSRFSKTWTFSYCGMLYFVWSSNQCNKETPHCA